MDEGRIVSEFDDEIAHRQREKLKAEYEWLRQPEHRHFKERPATVMEFLGPDYLDTGGLVSEGGLIRDAVAEALSEILGEETQIDKPTKFELAIITGAIGIGKSTIGAITLCYLCHWLLCLKDPQGFLGLLKGSKIAVMMMSTKGKQVRDVVFGDVKEMINGSPWFRDHPYDRAFKNEIRFDGNVWIIPGDSTETTFEGYNVLCGIIDEIDSHQVTPNKDYAEQGYSTIYGRMSSRFDRRGFLLLIGQKKKAEGFAARKFDEFTERDDAYATQMTIWESRGDAYYKERGPDGRAACFYYDRVRKMIVPDEMVAQHGDDGLLRVPNMYLPDFKTDPVKALRDLGGYPPSVEDPFFVMQHKIQEAEDRWVEENPGRENPFDRLGVIDPSWIASSSTPRTVHLDAAYASGGDAYGLCMAHVSGAVEVDGELKPIIEVDCLLRIQAAPGSEISFSTVRSILYDLRGRGKFNIELVTYDGLEGKDNEQQLRKKGFKVRALSVDKTTEPYYQLKDAVYEDRITYPPYYVPLRRGSPDPDVDILVRELSQLVDMGIKIDHPVPHGSKDVADCVAGVTYTLTSRSKLFKPANTRQGITMQPRQVMNHHARPMHNPAKHHPAYRQDLLREIRNN